LAGLVVLTATKVSCARRHEKRGVWDGWARRGGGRSWDRQKKQERREGEGGRQVKRKKGDGFRGQGREIRGEVRQEIFPPTIRKGIGMTT